jgi:glycosyltransferase involved in cell wall biosynthesis
LESLKVKVFLAVASLAPAYGGPAFSVTALARALADEGADVGVWSADGSHMTTSLLPDRGVRRLEGTTEAALRSFRPSVMHDNGLWLPHNHRIAALAARNSIPRVVSTRGMLEPWALAHKRWKKIVAWRAYQARDLRSAHRLHATSDEEARHLQRLRLGVPAAVIPNGVDPAPACVPSARQQELRVALFLGRLYPVKGLPMLVEAWSRTRPSGWRLSIAGPDESGHRRGLEAAIAAAGLEQQVVFLGTLDPASRSAALHEAELLVLPSHSESFGMAVAEALAHGTPVLTTTAVPWPELGSRGCGWRVEPTPDGLSEGLRVATLCTRETLIRMGERGQTWVQDAFGWRPIARRFLGLYEEMLEEYPISRTLAAKTSPGGSPPQDALGALP